MTDRKYVYLFAEGDKDQCDLQGGKGAKVSMPPSMATTQLGQSMPETRRSPVVTVALSPPVTFSIPRWLEKLPSPQSRTRPHSPAGHR